MMHGNRDWPDWYLTGLDVFFENVHPTLEPGRLVYEEVFESALFPLQRKEEMREMFRVANTISPRVVYEIGSDKGGSLYHWCRQPSVKRVIAAEIAGIPYHEHFKKAFPAIDFLWLPQSSYAKDSVSRVKDWLAGDRLDVVFIDGDKLQFKRDFEIVKPLLSDQAICLLHDIQDQFVGGPRFAFEDLAKSYPHVRLVNTTASLEAFEREQRGEPSNQYESWLRHWRGQSAGVGILYAGEDYRR